MSKQRAKTIAYWVTTVLGPGSFVIGGVLHLRGDASVLATLSHLGYPVYFASISGFWKLVGAVAVVVPGLPRLKEWAYAGFFFVASCRDTIYDADHIRSDDPDVRDARGRANAPLPTPRHRPLSEAQPHFAAIPQP